MKVCMLAYTFYETDNRVMRYAEELVKRGDVVDVIALKKKGQGFHETIGGVNLFRIQEREINEKGRLSYLDRILRFFAKSGWFVTKKHLKSRYDVIHVHSVPDFEVFAALIPKLMGAKVILDIHDIVPEFYASKFNVDFESIGYKLLILIEKLSIRFSNHVIASNHIWARNLESRSVRSEKCTTIMNYPDRTHFAERVRNRSDGRFVMIYPGSLNWHQGLDIAIKAMKIIKEEVPNADLHIYGEGASKNFLEDLIVQLELEERVFLKDFVPMKQIPEVMAGADLSIIPKRNDFFGGEAFSTKTLEFMSLGVPIIVSKTRIDEYYFDDSIVKFFESEDEEDLIQAILSMIKDKELRDRLAKNALKFIERNCWDVKKHIYLELVDSLVDRKPHNQPKKHQ